MTFRQGDTVKHPDLVYEPVPNAVTIWRDLGPVPQSHQVKTQGTQSGNTAPGVVDPDRHPIRHHLVGVNNLFPHRPVTLRHVSHMILDEAIVVVQHATVPPPYG